MNSLIKLGLMASLCLLFACNERKNAIALYDGLMESHMKTVTSLERSTNNSYAVLQERLEDDSKAKYRPLTPAIDTIHKMIEAVDASVDDLRKLPTIEKGIKEKKLAIIRLAILKLETSLLELFSAFLRKENTTFDLKEWQVGDRINSMKQDLLLVDSLWKTNNIHFSIEETRLLLSKTKVDLARTKLMLTNSLANLSGGRTLCGWRLLVPTVLPIQENWKKGEAFEALIFGFETLAPANVSLIEVTVDGQVIPVIEEKYAYYKSDVLKRSKTTIYINVTARNNLTGEEFNFSQNFPYEIVAD